MAQENKVDEADMKRLIAVVGRSIDPRSEEQRDSANTLRNVLAGDYVLSQELRADMQSAVDDYEARGGR